MPILVNDSIQNNSPKSLDRKYLNNGITPYASKDEAHAALTYKHIGLTVLITVNGVNVEYWYRSAIASVDDLVIKTAQTNSSGISEQDITSGSTAQISNQTTNIWVVINPTSILPAFAVTLPTTPYDAQEISFSVGGTITSGPVVTDFSVTTSGSQGIIARTSPHPNTLQVGDLLTYKYKSSNQKWYRIN